MPQKRKKIGLLFLTGALISMILLAASLSNMQLQAGTPFPGAGNSENTFENIIVLPDAGGDTNPVLRGVFAFSLLILMIYVAGRLISFVRIKQILWLLLVVGILFALVSLLPGSTHRQAGPSPTEYIELPAASSAQALTTPLGQPPQGLIWFLTIVIVLVLALLSIKVLRQWLDPTEVEDQLLEEAQDAVNKLKAGMDLKNVILRCYLQMAYALQEEQGIERSDHMTAQEFEAWLEAKGIPPVPVHQLTLLFEKARYSKQELSGDDERLAIDNLNEIIRFCRKEED